MSLVAGIDYSTHAIDVVLIDEDTLKPNWRRYEIGAFAIDWPQDAMDAYCIARATLAAIERSTA
jgi:hypothetical protein